MRVPVIANRAARRLWLQRHGLSGGPAGGGDADPADMVRALGFVQVDSVNTLARAHDMILWSRRGAWRPGTLTRLVARRAAFEHWTHDAAVIPIAYFPHWRLRFARAARRLSERWPRWQGPGFLGQVDAVLDRIAAQGECLSGDVTGDGKRAAGGWWDWHPNKTALEYLWHTGAVSVVRRDGFQKVYDLTERVIPAAHLAPRPDPDDSVAWFCNQAMDRLGFATSGEVAAFWGHVRPDEARAWCAAEIAAGRLGPVDVAAADGSLRRSLARPGTAESAGTLHPLPSRVRVLSPFDPALRDRARAERLFGFRYRIEIYVPAPKRVYGYYVFPVIESDSLIGRIDMRREGQALAVRAFWPEAGVAMGKGRQQRLMAELGRVATMAGCATVDLAPGWLRG